MFKALAVDDEPMMLEIWKTMVDWQACGYELCGTATDGAEALAAIRTDEPDLVVTDIRMPVLDGLGLVRAMKEELGARSKIVIVSGFPEFEYARKALSYQVNHYLLKPIVAAEFHELLRELAVSHNEERLEEATAGIALAAAASSAIIRLLRSGAPSAAETAERLLGTNGGARFRLLLAESTGRTAGSGLSSRDTSMRLRALAEAGFEGCLRYWLFDDSPLLAGMLVLDEDSFAQPFDNKLLEAAAAAWPLQDYGLYCSGTAVGIAALPELYRQAVETRYRALLLGNRTGIHVYRKPMQAESCRLEAVTAYAETLLQAVEEGDPERIGQSVDRLFRQLDRSSVLVAVRYICGGLMRKLADRQPVLSEAAALAEISLTDREPVDGARQAGESLKKICLRAAEALAGILPARGACSAAVREAVAHLKLHFRDKVRLNEYAERYHLNPVYFGQQFKRETGHGFNAYVHRIRVDEARKLLKWTDMKVSDIALGLGYHDSEYFTAKFKTLTGECPSDYRNKCRGEQHAGPTSRFS